MVMYSVYIKSYKTIYHMNIVNEKNNKLICAGHLKNNSKENECLKLHMS